MVDKPSPEEIKTFLEVFDTLSGFEAQTRFVRGYGAFNEKDLPFPAVKKVYAWLKENTHV